VGPPAGPGRQNTHKNDEAHVKNRVKKLFSGFAAVFSFVFVMKKSGGLL
jgi:hypothetical protein